MSEIVKVCKKHGELTQENTCLQRCNKKNKSFLLCRICKKENGRKWDLANPRLVKRSNDATRKKRLKELTDGTLQKNCNIHGLLPIEKIRIDTRGSRVCRLCDSELAKKRLAANGEKMREKAGEWRRKNPDKMRKYGQDYKPRRKVVAAKLRKKWMADPVQRQKIANWMKIGSKRSRETISDAYLKSMLRTCRQKVNGVLHFEYLKGVEVHQDFIDFYRVVILLKREIRKCRQLLKSV